MVGPKIPSLCAVAVGFAICACSVTDRYVVSDASASFDASDSAGSFGASACARCVFRSCSSEVTDCKGSGACTTYLDCIDACGVGADGGTVDQACQGRCWNASAGIGSSSISALSICMMNGNGASCAACGAGDAGLGEIVHQKCASALTAANACEECVQEKCCDTGRACQNDPSCAALSECESNCVNGLPDDAGASPEPPDGGGYACDLWCNAPTNPSLDTFVKSLACDDFLCVNAAACAGANRCSACIEQYCQNEYLGLLATRDGYLFTNCSKECTAGDASACADECLTTYPSAEGPALELDDCAAKHCPDCP